MRPRGRTFEAQIVGVDEDTDLAMLKVNAMQGFPLSGSAIRMRCARVRSYCAFGSPLGLENSMTLGVVSAVGTPARVPTTR